MTSLATLLQPWITLPDNLAALTITDMTLDSRAVTSGMLFVALNRGVEFIPQAIEQGAAAILVDAQAEVSETTVPVIRINNLAENYGLIASRFYGEPSKQLQVIGVTGTNGKTSTTYFIAHLLKQTSGRCGIIGTLGTGEPDNLITTGMTTPDAITVHKTLQQFVKAGMKYAAMEVSSHALDQNRVQGVQFLAAVFTNLTHDHLDYHKTMANYGAAKRKLFTEFELPHKIINVDDAFGKSLLTEWPEAKSYSVADASASIYARDAQYTEQGISAEIHSVWGDVTLQVPLLGAFNLSNALASIATVAALDIEFHKVIAAAKTLAPVPGRMQMLHAANKPTVIVDYAHTPDALQKALFAARQHCSGKLWCVFGCGGDRDRTKRPEMAAIAEQYADTVVVTSDNPRHEKPRAIIDDIVAGFTRKPTHIQADRAAAIQYAIAHAKAKDVILLAGKGHETYQQIGDNKLPFSDVKHAQHCLIDSNNQQD